MKLWIRFRTCLLFVLMFMTINVFSQDITAHDTYSHRKTRARVAINQLKEGVLIVRLPTKHKNIQELDRILRGLEIKDKTKARISKIKKQIIESRDHSNNRVILFFTTQFNFCPVYFIDDTCRLDDNKNHCLKDASGKSVRIELKKYLIAYPTKGQSLDVEGIQISDSYYKDLDKPFPSFTKFKYSKSFGFISRLLPKRHKPSGRKLNRRLHKLYDKVHEK